MELSIQNIHEMELRMLAWLAEYCQENGITYYLTDGTLLGAIRHKGFIPWDDDVDIAMPRQDYEKFVRSIPEFTFKENSYFLQTWDTDQYYAYPFAKLMDLSFPISEDTDTTAQKKSGIFIDIFPVDACPKPDCHTASFIAYLVLTKTLLVQSGYQLWNSHTLHRSRWKYLPFILLAHVFSRESLKKRITNITKSWNCKYSNTPWRFENIGYNFRPWIFNVQFCQSFEKHTFENHKFNIPTGWDNYLEQIYGEYMKLPPKYERQASHIS